jgi:hypothetical protein
VCVCVCVSAMGSFGVLKTNGEIEAEFQLKLVSFAIGVVWGYISSVRFR